MPSTRIFMSGVLGGALIIGGAVASAAPPIAGAPAQPVLRAAQGAPIVGRVRTRDRVTDLTAASLALGGAAHELVQGVAHVVHADINREMQRSGLRDDARGGADRRDFGQRSR